MSLGWSFGVSRLIEWLWTGKLLGGWGVIGWEVESWGVGVWVVRPADVVNSSDAEVVRL